MDLITLLLLTVVFLAALFWYLRPDPRLPPFPVKPWPIIGHLFALEDDPRPQFNKWYKEVGEIFSLYMAGTNVVVLNGYDLLKETFVRRADEFSDRPIMFYDAASGLPGKGVIMNWGPEWKEQRNVMMSILRSFGVGKNIMERNMLEECSHYLEMLKNLKGEPTDLRTPTNASTSNIICTLVVGQRFEYDDPVFKDLMVKACRIVGEGSPSGLITYLPSLRYLPGDFFGAKASLSDTKKVMDVFVNKFVNQKKNEEFDENNIDNLIAAYVAEWNKKLQAKQATSMSDEHLVKIVFDLFVAGTTTAATSLLWCILYAINHPKLQERLFLEIESEIGLNRPPSMQDRNKLPLVYAFITEALRLSNVAAFALPHELKKEVTVRGYTLPKGTTIIPNFDTCVYDPQIWGEDVFAFRPERFLDKDGKHNTPEEFTPFGMGRRICPGESMAKTMLFLYMVSILQRFKLEPENPASPPPMDAVFGLDVNPHPFKVRVLDRTSAA